MTYDTLNYHLDERGVARVTLDQPQVHNALSPEMMQQLIAVFSEIALDDAVRVVVLSGNGKSFCAGGDLKWMQSNLDKPRAQRIAESKVLSELFDAIDRCPKLVVARINGAAYGGGIGLIAVCDIAIALDSAKFALTEVKLGLVPANIAPYTLRKIGAAGMRRLALNAHRIDAGQAQRMGLIDEVADAEQLDARVEAEVDQALSAGPMAIAHTKTMIAELEAGQLQDPAQAMVEKLADVWEGDEAQAGIRAFFTRQSPPWRD